MVEATPGDEEGKVMRLPLGFRVLSKMEPNAREAMENVTLTYVA